MTTATAPAPTPPSRRRITAWGVSLVFCLIALFTSGYLSIVTLTGSKAICVEGSYFDCSTVENSIYSKLAGVPVAYLGFATYATILALLLLEKRYGFFREYAMLIILGLSVFGFLFHCYLTLMSVTRLGAICPWCVVTNFSMGVIMVATLIRVLRAFVFTGPEKTAV